MDNTNEDAVVINTEVEEATNSNEDSIEETVDLSDELEKERQAKSQILARAKKAEAELKELKAKSSLNNDPQLSDELKLIARGLSDEEIEQAKIIAKGKGIALPEAIKEPLFLTFQSDLKDKKRKEDAKLGASKGSGESKDESGITSNMTRDEHMKAFKKVMG